MGNRCAGILPHCLVKSCEARPGTRRKGILPTAAGVRRERAREVVCLKSVSKLPSSPVPSLQFQFLLGGVQPKQALVVPSLGVRGPLLAMQGALVHPRATRNRGTGPADRDHARTVLDGWPVWAAGWWAHSDTLTRCCCPHDKYHPRTTPRLATRHRPDKHQQTHLAAHQRQEPCRSSIPATKTAPRIDAVNCALLPAVTHSAVCRELEGPAWGSQYLPTFQRPGPIRGRCCLQRPQHPQQRPIPGDRHID